MNNPTKRITRNFTVLSAALCGLLVLMSSFSGAWQEGYPLPSVELHFSKDGKTYDQAKGKAKIADLQRIWVKVVPAPGHIEESPMDARFRVPQTRVVLKRKGADVASHELKGERIDLAPIMAKAQKGDQLVIMPLQLMHMNAEHKVDRVEMELPSWTIALK